MREGGAPESGSRAGLRIGLAGTFTVDPLVPMLGVACLDRGLHAPRIQVGPYSQLFQVALDHRAAFGGELDAIALLWRIEDLFDPWLERYCGGEREALEGLLDELDDLVRAVGRLRGDFEGTLVVSTPPLPDVAYASPRDLLAAEQLGRLHRRVVEHWLGRLDEVGRFPCLDLDGLQRDFGAASAGDPRKWYLYRQPWVEEFWERVGQDLARLLAAGTAAPRKCVVIDCDDTLWGGIVGEEGIEGIELGDDFPGSAFLDFQRELLGLRARGVLLAVASNNNEQDALEVFDRHDRMLLRRGHLSAWRIDWEPKSSKLPDIARQLNIGTDSLVFVDDSSFEIEQVRAALPEVACVQVPDEIALLPGTLTRSGLFDRLEVTEDDRRRAQRIGQERRRENLAGSLSREDFLASLKLEVEVAGIRPAQVARVVQLVNKTNQFNLTTRRRTRDEIDSLLQSPEHELFTLQVTDRFGDYGLVGVAILARRKGEVWELDTFLMSCRTLGRGVETAFLACLASAARDRGILRLEGRYLPTRKNGLVKDFFADHGFEAVGDDRWAVPPASIPGVPAHIALR